MLRLVARLWLDGGKRLFSARAGLPDVAPWWEAAVQCACWSAGHGSAVGNACSVRGWSAGRAPWWEAVISCACPRLDVAGESDQVVWKAPTVAESGSAVGNGHPARGPDVRMPPGSHERQPRRPDSPDDPHEPSDPSKTGAQTTRAARTTRTSRYHRKANGHRTARPLRAGSSAAGAVRRGGGAEGVRGRIRQPPATRPAVPGVGHQPGVAERDRDWVTVLRASGRSRRSGLVDLLGQVGEPDGAVR